MNYTDIFIACPITDIQNMIQHVFYQNGFKVAWYTSNTGKATKGSKGENIALGAFAQYYEIDFQILAMPDQTSAVRLIKATSGWWGGIIGAHKVERQYKDIVDMLSNYFMSLGVFRGRNPP
ncbi:MAG: hypothetical protein JSW28_00135 [Thermoplasmata archaeon]|nr:MAG: hypothetical protein JSW28_00135 [Thermoplasmata archaeon]